jgi:hypothetical protein
VAVVKDRPTIPPITPFVDQKRFKFLEDCFVDCDDTDCENKRREKADRSDENAESWPNFFFEDLNIL